MFTQNRLVEVITYWAPTGSKDRYGRDVFEAPVLINGRWEDKLQQVRLPSGEEVTSSATVYSDTDLLIGGYVGEGDLTTNADPMAAAVPSREIQSYGTVPNLRSLGKERIAYL